MTQIHTYESYLALAAHLSGQSLNSRQLTTAVGHTVASSIAGLITGKSLSVVSN